MTSWRPPGRGIGSSNGRFQPVVLRGAMRALPRGVRDVDQVFLDPVTVEDIAARAFQNRCCMASRVPIRSAAAASQCPTARIFSQSNPSDRATPGNQPRCVSTTTPATRSQNRREPRRRWRPCHSVARSDSIPDRNHNATPTDPHHGDCRCGSRSCRRTHPRRRCASIPRARQAHGSRRPADPPCGSFGNCRERSLSVDVHQCS
jgi:hypothetical protein